MASQTSSKYDFVKVKVWVGPEYTNCFVLSRFLLSRMLTVIRIDNAKAVRVALQVKKFFVDKDILHVPIDAFEKILFFHLLDQGFSVSYLQRYLRVSDFVARRVPLVVLLSGPPFELRRMLAQELASRLNMQNVQQSDLMYHIVKSTCTQLAGVPVPTQAGPDPLNVADSEVLRKYRRECLLMRRALSGDLHKALRSGKSVILDGLHVDPGLYMWEFGLLDAIEALNGCSHTDNGSTASCMQGSQLTARSNVLQALPGRIVRGLPVGTHMNATAGIVAAVGRMPSSLTDVCMMLRSNAHAKSCVDPHGCVASLVRMHCEQYACTEEVCVQLATAPASVSLEMMAPYSGAAALGAHSPGDGMSVHERMRHWWSTRTCAEPEQPSDERSPRLEAASADHARSETHCQSWHALQEDSGHHDHHPGMSNREANALDAEAHQPQSAGGMVEGSHDAATLSSQQMPNLLTHLERAWAAVSELQEQRQHDSKLLDEVYSDRSHAQGVNRPLPLFVPLVVVPHECDTTIFQRDGVDNCSMSRAWGQTCSPEVGMLQGSGWHQRHTGRHNSDAQHRPDVDQCSTQMVDAQPGLTHVEDLLRSYDFCGVPVAELHHGNYEDTLDLLHDHVLCSIEHRCGQMQSEEAQPPP
eukprot:jgi/Ulvmu1/7375/UM036_0035.1